MIEPIQITPPLEALASFDLAASDTKAGTTHTSSIHPVAPAKEEDTVTLSSSAEANQLYLQGNSVSQIEALLGLSASAVDSDLNISQDGSLTAQAVAGTTAATEALPSATASTPFTQLNSPGISEARIT